MATYAWNHVGCARGAANGQNHVGGAMGGIVGGCSRASNDIGLEGGKSARCKGDGVKADPGGQECKRVYVVANMCNGS